MGAGTLVERLEQFTQSHGERYAPAAILRELAERGERFYPGDPAG